MTHSLARFRAVSMGSSSIQPTHAFVCSGDVGHYEDTENTGVSEAKCFFPMTSLEKRQTWAHWDHCQMQNEANGRRDKQNSASDSGRKLEGYLYDYVMTASSQNPESAGQWNKLVLTFMTRICFRINRVWRQVYSYIQHLEAGGRASSACV